MNWVWLALVDDWPSEATAAAWARSPTGEVVGALGAWARRAKPARHARRMDVRMVDTTGPAATVSLVLPPDGVRLAFDDTAVQQARREVFAREPFDAVSTLLSDASHFEGSVTVARGADVLRVNDDPFARIFPARVLDVDSGLFGRTPPPAGPTIERYGSAQPWPWDRFE